MNERSEFLSRRLESSRLKTMAFFQQISDAQWQTKIYTEGASWTLQQILAHNVMAEDSMLRLMQNIIAGGEGVREDFDLDAYNEYKVGKMDGMSPEELLLEFDKARQETIKAVSQFGEADLDKTGCHPWLGVACIEEIIKLMFRHNQIHIREIRSVLKL